MAAVLAPTEQEWEIIQKFISQIRQSCVSGQGAVVISPTVQKKMAEFGMTEPISSLVNYDFGGEADFHIDVVNPTDDDSAEWLESVTKAEFERALEDGDLDIKLEGAALAYGFRPSWAKNL
jgi:hypothetical protein